MLKPKNTQTSNKVGFTSATTSPSGLLGGRSSNLQLNKQSESRLNVMDGEEIDDDGNEDYDGEDYD